MRIIDAVEYQGFWGSFGDLIWWFLWAFVFFTYLMALFVVIGDLFRDHKLNGWWKAVWIIFLIFVPFLTLLVYLIARGKGMSERGLPRPRSTRPPRISTSSRSPVPARPKRSRRRSRSWIPARSPRPSSTTSRPRRSAERSRTKEGPVALRRDLLRQG